MDGSTARSGFPAAVSGGHLLRLVIDAVNECNLRCRYCHPGQTWISGQLGVDRLREVLAAAESRGLLEVVLTGGEITMHHDLPGVLEATALLERTACTLITNATRMTTDMAHRLGGANLARICTSVDGVDNATHGVARGRNLKRVMDGLELLAGSGAPITVITVVHRRNWQRALELTDLLAERGLAEQHHLCAPSYSGQAREHYAELALREEEFHGVQGIVDRHHGEFAERGLYLTFNSFWPATGIATRMVNPGRSITLQQLSEQVKTTLCNVRPDGEFRFQAATWGREMAAPSVLGTVHDTPPEVLFAGAEDLITSGGAGQLPRHVEARHKFQLGRGADTASTDQLIGRRATRRTQAGALPPVHDVGGRAAAAGEELVSLIGPEQHWILDNRLPTSEVAAELAARPGDHRIVGHPSGLHLLFDRRRSMITLIRPDERPALDTALDAAPAPAPAR